MSRQTWSVAVFVGLIAAGATGWAAWRWHAKPAVPEYRLDDADPEVAQAVRAAADAARRTGRADAWGKLGMTLLANQFARESAEAFAQAERLAPADVRWPYLRGVALSSSSPDDAIPCLRRAAEAARPGEGADAARLRLAEALAGDGRDDEAADWFAQVAEGPLSPCAEYGLGAVAARRGDAEAARRHLAKCADSPFARRKAAVLLASLGVQAGLPPADVAWPDPYLAECLEFAAGRDGRSRLVVELERRGETGKALERQRALADDYPDAPTLLALGIMEGRTGRFAESEATLRRCLSLEPGLVRAHYYLSLALLGQGEALARHGRPEASAGKLEAAAGAARRAAELAPQNGEAHLQLGLSLVALKRRGEAVEAFRRAVATRPELPDVHLWLGKALAEEGKREEGVAHLRQAVRYAGPNDARAKQELDRVLKGP